MISGNNKVENDELQSVVLGNSSVALINFWPIKITSASIFLTDTGKISNEILKKFPTIEKAEVNKNYPKTLALTITERQPSAVYCQSNGQQCFLIDENGVIYETQGSLPENFVVIKQTLGDTNLYAGENVVSPNIMLAIAKIQKDLKDKFNIDIKQALVTGPTRLNITTGENWQVYFNLSDTPDTDSQIVKLNSLLSGDINSDVRKTLQYIDLRFEDRAYYK